MQPINRVNFEILKSSDHPGRSTFDTAIYRILDWLKRRSFVQDPGAVLDLDEMTSEKEVGADVLVESIVYKAGETKAWGVRFSHPDSATTSLRWIGEVTLYDKGGSQIYYSNTLGISQSDERVEPVEVHPSNPTLNREILAALKGQTRHKHRLFSKPHVLNEDTESINIFVRIVENKDRSHPLIMVTPGNNNLPLVNPEALARSLAGMAHVLVAESNVAAIQASNSLPAGLGCQNGSIRIYWPDFHRNKDPYRHSLFLDWEVLKLGDKFPGRLVEVISRQAVIRIPEDYIQWSELQTASLRQAIQNGSQAGDTLELLGMFEADNVKQQQALAAANSQIARLNEILNKIRQQVEQLGATLQDVGSDELSSPIEFSSDYEAVQEDEAEAEPYSEDSAAVDESAQGTDEAATKGGLPFYYSTYASHFSRELYQNRMAHPKGTSNSPPQPSGKERPDYVTMKGGERGRTGDWFYDANYGFGVIIKVFSGEYYDESTDGHKVFIFKSDGKYSIINNFKLKVTANKVNPKDIPEGTANLYASLKCDP